MMNVENTNQSVAGVVIKDNRVLLARHTYGNGKGMLIIPGGYVNLGEAPQDALRREFMEETHILVEPKSIIGIRFNIQDWYIVFAAEYVSGQALSDHDENSEVLWMDVQQALARDDVPELTKKMIESAVSQSCGLQYMDYQGNPKQAPYSLYAVSDFDKKSAAL
ncbi:MAG: NUDIX hydrolase [Lachnospiraceae bacterium]|nr:NUDIX hydrolase [Lachnospiraceae bacterium]